MWDAETPPARGYRCVRTLRNLLLGILFILIAGYLMLPIVFRYSSTVKSNLAFLNFAKNYRANYYRPGAVYGLPGARNFYLTTSDGATLGVWHSLPSELQIESASLDTEDLYNTTVTARYQDWLQHATVFIYCHGTAGSRASYGRVELYKVLNRLGFHVITFDYRGYGDSSGHPTTEQDVATDALTVVNWVRRHVGDGKIFLWGHSLGSGVVSNLLANLESDPANPVVGAVLESSFNNLLDALRAYPPSMPYSNLPGFDFFAVEPIANQGLLFQSEEYLKNVSVPLLFLHAEDDHVVPYRLGVKLYEAVVSSREDLSTVTFVTYDKGLGYGHMRIYADPNLGGVVNDFVKKSIDKKNHKVKVSKVIE